jgi:superfamily II DNA or RNA helicase
MYVPRDYQTECIDEVFITLKNNLSALIVLATGTGKTEIYLQIVSRWLTENPGQRALIIAHREELRTQPAKRWRRDHDEWPAIEMADLRAGNGEWQDQVEQNDMFDGARTNNSVVIASIPTLNSGKRCKFCTADCRACFASGQVISDCDQCGGTGQYTGDEWAHDSRECYPCEGSGKVKSKCSECLGDGWICIQDECEVCFEHFTRRMQKFNPLDFGLIVIDEAHHSVADTYARTVRYFRSVNPEIRLLGCTATPDRADEEALGQVFHAVAYEYNLPQPILDGWLTPIDQQLITVEDLNLANVRTTAGDLNKGDLEQEMMAEKVIHKMTTPLIEIACGMQPGDIDAVVRVNQLDQLPSKITKREPTLIHAVDVAHAERMTEIINRYLPESALCIIGTTPKNIRRDGLRRFAEGHYQFLLSCGVFLEGTDLPNVSIIGMARPTKSRALYSQMLGRGLRPLPGIIDGILDPETRCERIALSGKPRCLVVDFVGNSGRHKLINSTDVLGHAFPDELVEGVIRKAVKLGQPVDILQALNKAQVEAEEEARRQAMRQAAANAALQEAAERRAIERRRGVVAGVSYSSQSINPFDVMDVAAKREPAWHKGRMPSERMKEVLRKAKVPFTEETTFWEAHLLIDEVMRRRQDGLCTYRMAQLLKEYGYHTELSFSEASAIIDSLKANGWRRPEGESVGDSSDCHEQVSVAS